MVENTTVSVVKGDVVVWTTEVVLVRGTVIVDRNEVVLVWVMENVVLLDPIDTMLELTGQVVVVIVIIS